MLHLKTLARACALSVLGFAAHAENGFAYTVTTVDPDYIGFGSISLDAGQVVWSDFDDAWSLNRYSNGQLEVIKTTDDTISDVHQFAGGVYWTEAFRSNPKELFALEGSELMLTSSGAEKAAFTYDEGTAAWFERVNGAYELFYYDGANVQQLTQGSSFFPATQSSEFLQLDNGQVAFQAFADGTNSVFFYDGSELLRLSPVGVQATMPDVESGTVVWLQEDAAGVEEVYQYQSGVTTQLTADGSVLEKTDTQIANGIVSWETLNDSTGQSSTLWVLENGTVSMLSDTVAQGRAQFDAGKIVWTEGDGGAATRIVERSDGEIRVVHVGENPINLIADGGYLVWREGLFPNNPTIMLASPEDDKEPGETVNVGPEHSSTPVSVDGSVTLVASEWSTIGWTPSRLTFGITPTDGRPLEGVTVIDEAGNTYSLGDWWQVVSQDFTGDPRMITIETSEPRELSVQWWVE